MIGHNNNNAAIEEVQKLQRALAFLTFTTEFENPGFHLEVAGALKSYGDAGYHTWAAWCRKSPSYPGDQETRAQWDLTPPSGRGFQFVYQAAKAAGWDVEVGGETAYTSQVDLPPQYSEERLAAEYTIRFGADWRYVAEWSRWYSWCGTRWAPDATLHAFDQARVVAREASARARHDEALPTRGREGIATAIASSKTIAAIERIARTDRVHALASGDWDKDEWLFNTPGGIVDVRTMKPSPHERSLYITKLAGAAPGGGCTTWNTFLKRVTGNDVELERFLQRFIGSCLTGCTRDHALLFCYGLGGNGKTTFLSTIAGALGDYATTAPMETFVETHSERHPTDLAMLRGARLVVAQEVEDGQRWAISRIKQLTGGDTVRARFMRQDYFEYTPQFKLILAGNHKPSFRQVDEAIRRRFLLVPFTQTIGPAERDTRLVEKLRGEWPGVLAWAMAGCKEWQAHGLQPPESVRAATAAYLEDEDLLRTWLSEACETDSKGFATVSELHASYQGWAERAGERFLGMKRFSQALEDHGFRRDRLNGGNRVRGFGGLRLRTAQGRLG